MLKGQQFKDKKSDKMELKSLKRQRLYLRDNKEEKDLNKFDDKGEGKSIEYIPFFFVAPP